MKKYMMVFLLAMVAMFLMMPLAIAEAVDAVPVEGSGVPIIRNAEFLDAAALLTFAGAMAAAEALFLLLKTIFRMEGTAARVTVALCSIFAVGAGKLLGGESLTVSAVIMTIFNAAFIALALMKLYELTAGYSKTPAGNI